MSEASTQSAATAPAQPDSDSFKKLLPDFPSLRQWKLAGNDQAFAEGWGLFEVDGRYQLQRLDNPADLPELGYEDPKFNSDMDALAHVVQQAVAGSVYHAEAMYSIGGLVA